MKLSFTLLSLGVIGTVVGCAGPHPIVPAPYSLFITAERRLNPDMENRSTPVQVRIYELKNSSRFESSDFVALWEKDDATLGDDVLNKEQITLQPGQRMRLDRTAKQDARMLGVFVGFKNLEKSTWRAVTPLPRPKELGRFGIFNPSFKPTTVNVVVGATTVVARTYGQEAPTTIPGTGGLQQSNRAQYPTYSRPTFTRPTYTPPTYSVPSYSAPSYSAPSVTLPSYTPPSVNYPSATLPQIPSNPLPSSIPTYPGPTFQTPTPPSLPSSPYIR